MLTTASGVFCGQDCKESVDNSGSECCLGPWSQRLLEFPYSMVYFFFLWEKVLSKSILLSTKFAMLALRATAELGACNQAHMELSWCLGYQRWRHVQISCRPTVWVSPACHSYSAKGKVDTAAAQTLEWQGKVVDWAQGPGCSISTAWWCVNVPTLAPGCNSRQPGNGVKVPTLAPGSSLITAAAFP